MQGLIHLGNQLISSQAFIFTLRKYQKCHFQQTKNRLFKNILHVLLIRDCIKKIRLTCEIYFIFKPLSSISLIFDPIKQN